MFSTSIISGLCIALSSGEDTEPVDVASFLADLQELVPQRYEGDAENESLYVDVKAGFKLRASGAPDLGLPVSEDVVLSIRRSAETDNTLKRCVCVGLGWGTRAYLCTTQLCCHGNTTLLSW